MYDLALNHIENEELLTPQHAHKDTLEKDKEYHYFDRLHWQKYRDNNQSRLEHTKQLSHSLSTDNNHFTRIFDCINKHRFIPAGRIQAALGATEREVSPFNCSVSVKIGDSIPKIYKALSQAAMILRLGTGIGYNFSHLRPKGALVKKLQAQASGPMSFMKLFNQSAALIESAGHRRGAQMGILNVNHPDIEEFIDSKMEKDALSFFNISVGVSDAFMQAVKQDAPWELVFKDEVYKTISAKELWDKILRNAYDSAEPGVVYLDRMNGMNNLWYCEEIEATNPCSEQPLPPYGLCTLGSFNLVGYIRYVKDGWMFNLDQFEKDIFTMVEAYDNIFDAALYAIPEHEAEAIAKRRIGLGLTGIANAIELIVGEASYGDKSFCMILDNICRALVHTAYEASVELAKKRGPFPLFNPVDYPNSKFIQTLPGKLQDDIEKYGIRNSHLISYAPCGTISQIAGNISSGVEPVFYHEVSRNVILKEGKEKITLKDFAYREFGFKGRTLEECTVDQHLAVAEICQKHCDSAVSKTINTPADIAYEDYRSIYERAYDMGLKGITVYRPAPEVIELRGAVITKAESRNENEVAPEEPVNTSELSTFSCASGVCER